MNYAFEKALGGAIKVFPVDDQGCIPFGANVIATFSNDDEGQKAFALYRSALAATPGSSLININTGRYEIGTLAQVAA